VRSALLPRNGAGQTLVRSACPFTHNVAFLRKAKIMGSVFKKTVTRPLPNAAEIITRHGVRLARWRDGKRQVEDDIPDDREGRGRTHSR
jgi:hypothetical protein